MLAQSRRRRLVLTRGALLERRPATYEVAERRQLGQVSALVRFADEPEWLGVEWADGGTAAMYVTPAREALLAALLDAAQACAHRLIPVLPTPTNPGDVALGNLATPCLACPVQLDMELERMCLHHMAAACASACCCIVNVACMTVIQVRSWTCRSWLRMVGWPWRRSRRGWSPRG